MEFAVERCAMQIMKSGKQQMMERIELLNQEKIRTFGEKETYKYLGIKEADSIKHQTIIPQENEKITRNQITYQLSHQKKKFWSILLVRYSGPFLKWTREELQQIGQRTMKLKIMHKALHQRDEEDSLYESRKNGGRGLSTIEVRVHASIQRLEDNIKRLITAIRNIKNNKSTNRKLCKKFKFDHTNKWYIHNPESLLEN